MGARRGCNQINTLRLRFVPIGMYENYMVIAILYLCVYVMLNPCLPFWPVTTILSGCSWQARGVPWSKGDRKVREEDCRTLCHWFSVLVSSSVAHSSLCIHEFTLNSSPRGKKFGNNLHEERDSLCPAPSDFSLNSVLLNLWTGMKSHMKKAWKPHRQESYLLLSLRRSVQLRICLLLP